MAFADRHTTWEVLAIHLVTGLLFLPISEPLVFTPARGHDPDGTG